MLQTKTVRPNTYALLKKLMGLEILSSFNLAGGTSLSLQIGHRTSTDLDFFGKTDINFDFVKTEIIADFDFHVQHDTKNILIGFIDGVKVDFVRYKYDLLNPPIVKDGIRLLSVEDIGCMKLSAIIGRGRKRDFFDLFFIMKQIPFGDLLNLYQSKYYDGSLQLILKSIVYFDDAESDEYPFLFEEVSWEEVKESIELSFKNYYKTL